VSGQLSRCQDIPQEVDQGLGVPDAAEALRKTLELEEAEDLRIVLTRTGSPGLRPQEVALEAGAEAREEDHRKTAQGGPGLPGDDPAALRGPDPAMSLLPGVEEAEVAVAVEVVEAEMEETEMTLSLTSAWECSD